jgi:hypothetical protein
MQPVSTPAAPDLVDGSPPLRVFDSFMGDKRLVTAVVQAPEGDRGLVRLAKQTRDFAMTHARSFGSRGAVHLVQIFDRDIAGNRVADVLGHAKAGALVIFFGRSAEECLNLVEALGVHLVMASSPILH